MKKDEEKTSSSSNSLVHCGENDFLDFLTPCIFDRRSATDMFRKIPLPQRWENAKVGSLTFGAGFVKFFWVNCKIRHSKQDCNPTPMRMYTLYFFFTTELWIRMGDYLFNQIRLRCNASSSKLAQHCQQCEFAWSVLSLWRNWHEKNPFYVLTLMFI